MELLNKTNVDIIFFKEDKNSLCCSKIALILFLNINLNPEKNSFKILENLSLLYTYHSSLLCCAKIEFCFK